MLKKVKSYLAAWFVLFISMANATWSQETVFFEEGNLKLTGDMDQATLRTLWISGDNSVFMVSCNENGHLNSALILSDLTKDLANLKGATVTKESDYSQSFAFHFQELSNGAKMVIFDPEHMRLESRAAISLLKFVANSKEFSIQIGSGRSGEKHIFNNSIGIFGINYVAAKCGVDLF